MPTYNRQDYALRAIHYWAGFDVNLYVLDGSLNPIDPALMNIDDSSIKYIHMPIGLAKRLGKVVDLIDEPYISWVCDDEFFLPTALSNCINFLEKNLDYAACTGRCLAFEPYIGDQIFGHDQYPKLADYDMIDEDPLIRVVSHMKNYTPSILYAVQRAQSWKVAHRAYAQAEFAIFAQAELQVELVGSFAGKTKVLQELMWLRSMEALPIRGTEPSLDERSDFSRFWSSANDVERKYFIDIIANAYKQVNTIYLGDYTNAAYMTTAAYLTYINGFRKSKSIPYKIITLLLPNFVKGLVREKLRALRKIIRTRLPKKIINRKPIILAAKELESTNVAVNFKELENVIRTVKTFHMKKNG